MKKRYIVNLLAIIVILFGLVASVLPTHTAEAGTETYNHIIPFTITDTSGTARTNVPVIISYDVNGNLVAYGLLNATATNSYVDSSGASNSPVGSGTAYDYAMATSNITAVIPSLPAYGSVTLNLYTGYSPAQTSFPIILGSSGYITTSDAASLEPAGNFAVNVTGTLGGTAGLDKDIFNKAGSVALFEGSSTAGNITGQIGGLRDTFIEDNWTSTTPAKMSVDTTTQRLDYDALRGNGDDRIYYALSEAASNTQWRFDYTWNPTSTPVEDGNVWAWGLWSSLANFQSYGGDNIIAIQQNPSKIKLLVTDGGSITSTAQIDIVHGTTYYVTLERLSATEARLSLFTDSARTTHLTGSPLTLTIPATITNLAYIQGSNYAGAGLVGREIGWVDNINLSSAYMVNTTGVTSGSQIDLSANTTHLKLSIDGVLKDSLALSGATAPNKASSWLFMQNASMPAADNITLTVSGTRQLYYAPNALISGTTLPDRENSNDGTITWGTNSNITVAGGDIMDSDSATNVGVTSAMMQSELTNIGTYTTVYLSFQYGLDTNYGYSTSETSTAVAVTNAVTLTGLTPNTTYHYRAIARSGSVYSYGQDTTFTTAFSTASQGSTTPLIQSIGAFANYQETGDYLFTAEIVVTYPPYYPTDIAYKYFQVQLVDTDGSTILGASPVSQWGDRPSSIYFSASGNGSISYGSAYQIRITNISSANITISTSDTFGDTDWYGTDLTRLDEWCIGVAQSMQNTDGTLLTDPYIRAVTGIGLVITNTAGGFFTKGIPNIETVRPNLFLTGLTGGARDTLSGTTGYNSGTTLTNRVGATIVTDAGTVGTVFNLSGQQFLLFMILAVVIGFLVFTVGRTGGIGALPATILAVPIIGASNYFNIMDIALPVIGLVILAWLFVRQFIWKTL